MGKLLNDATTIAALRKAWRSVRSNGLQSILLETRQAAAEFDKEVDKNLPKIQKELRQGSFKFDPQKAIKKRKKGGSYRGIVMASIRNRIVERALLNCLQEKVAYVKEVIETPTCVGGVPDRSVPHGLAQINSAFQNKNKYFVRSDITGFFDNIPRDIVLKKLAQHVEDQDLLDLLDSATTFSALNERALGEDRKLFPMNYEGVAQGSPLSPLFGNILLHEFDMQFNQKGVVCVRFIDDFILIGSDAGRTIKAFQSAQRYLTKFGLSCHDPYKKGTSKDKAQHGHIDKGFVFLGYDIRPGLLQPSRTAKAKVLQKVKDHIFYGKKNICSSINRGKKGVQGYAQILELADNVIKGWGNSFSYCNSPTAFIDLDRKIELEMAKFREWFQDEVKDASMQERRRAEGVGLLEDIEMKSLSKLPFRLPTPPYKYRKTKNGAVFSTDGSLQNKEKMKNDGQLGIGGWSVVSHKDGTELYGSEDGTTINRMELKAVIEALKLTQAESYVLIRSDSRYVVNIAENRGLIRENHDLWEQYIDLRDFRKVRIEKVPAHTGDQHNGRADELAKKVAQERLKNKKEKRDAGRN